MTTNKRLLDANKFKELIDEINNDRSLWHVGQVVGLLCGALESGRLDAQPAEVNAPVDDGLLPCPFCGKVPPKDSFYMNQGDKWGGVQCCIQGPEVRTKYDRSHDAPWNKDAIEAWNTRTRPTSQWIPVSERLPEIGQVVRGGQPVSENRDIILNATWEFYPSKGYGPHWYATSPDVPGLHLIVKSLDNLVIEADLVSKKLFHLNEKEVSVTVTAIHFHQSVEEPS